MSDTWWFAWQYPVLYFWWADSNRTPTEPTETWPPPAFPNTQSIPARYIRPGKLEKYLNQKYGGDYRIEVCIASGLRNVGSPRNGTDISKGKGWTYVLYTRSDSSLLSDGEINSYCQ